MEHYKECPTHEDNFMASTSQAIEPDCECDDIHYDKEADAADQARSQEIEDRL